MFIRTLTLLLAFGWLADSPAMAKLLFSGAGNMTADQHRQMADIYANAMKKSIAEGFGDAAGNAANNFWRANNQAFQQNGHGQQAMNNMMKTMGQAPGHLFHEFGNHFEKGGEAGKAFEKMGAQFKEGGEASEAMANTATGFNREFINRIFNNLHMHGLKAAGVAILAVGGASLAITGSKLLYEYIKKEIKKPAVVLESSKPSFIERIRNIFSRKEKDLRPMVFAPAVEQRLNEISATTKVIIEKIKAGNKSIKLPSGILLYGPPGTGKTMFAKQLAYKSDMEYVFLTGASFAEKGAIQVMNDLFKWAERSKRPVMFFVDEADALLANRAKLKVDGNAMRAINHFLNFTGTRNQKTMCVFATNRKHIIDPAMMSRIDYEVEIGLPGFNERVRVLQVYRDLVLGNVKENGQQFVEVAKRIFNDAKINEVAQQTEGLANRDLEGIINTIKAKADITQSGMITDEVINTAVERFVEKYQSQVQNQVAIAA